MCFNDDSIWDQVLDHKTSITQNGLLLSWLAVGQLPVSGCSVGGQ